MNDRLVRELLGLTDRDMKPEPVFRRKSLDEMLEGKGTLRGGAASLDPIPEPGSVADENARADATAAEAAARPIGSGTGFLPDPGTGREYRSATGAQVDSQAPIWNRVPVTPPDVPKPPKFLPWWEPPRTAQAKPVAPVQQPAGIDRTTGSPFWQRAAAGIKTTPEGKTSYLESVYGEGNVVTRPDGETAYLNPDTGHWTQFDEQGVGLGDIADIGGGAMELAPAFFGPPDPLTVAARSVAGNAIRQAISGALPGDDYPQGGLSEVGGRLGEIARSGVFGGAGQKGANITVGQLRNILADPAKRATLSPAAIAALGNEAGMRFGEKTADNLTPELLDWLSKGADPGWE